MKRSPMPPRRQPMKRVSLKRDITPKPTQRTSLKQVSDKRQQENRERAKVLAKKRAQGVGCQLQAVRECTGAMTDGHEVWTRGRGGSIVDEVNIVMACRPCHRWVTEHPAEADCRGFTIPRWAIDRFGAEYCNEQARRTRENPKGCALWCEKHRAIDGERTV